MKFEVKPDYPIKAQIIADSISANHLDSRMTTYELEMPRYIWAEVLTHKMLGKNAQSSRAVPVLKVLEVNRANPVEPIVWGKNQGGMSASEILEGDALENAKSVWRTISNAAFNAAELLYKIGLHKSWANRVTEAFSTIKVVVSGTEWDNFFFLRDDEDAAQPEIVHLARMMKYLYDTNDPELLYPGEWHTPYVSHRRLSGVLFYVDSENNDLTVEEALQISASCCAQVSYRKLNDSKEKAIEIYDKLFDGPKPHESPTEHQASPMKFAYACNNPDDYLPENWEIGITHARRDSRYGSGNLVGFIQYRQVRQDFANLSQ